MLYKDHAACDIESAVDKALSANTGSSQAVEHILKSTQEHPSFITLKNWQTLSPPDVTIYGQIGGAI
jgi:hypothetical protein